MEDQPKKKSGCLLYGCIGAVVLMILVGVGGFFGVKKVMGMAADEMYKEVSADMVNMNLTDEERAEADGLLQQLRDGVKSGEIGFSDMETLVNALEDSDLKEYAGLLTGRKIIDSNQELSDEEKTDGKLQISRFAEGLSTKVFTSDDFEDLLSTISDQDADGEIEVKKDPSADELRAMIAKAKTMSDEADLGSEGFQMDFVGELRALVDKVMPPE